MSDAARSISVMVGIVFVGIASVGFDAGSLIAAGIGLAIAGVFFLLGGVNYYVDRNAPINVGPTSRFGDSRGFRALRWWFGTEFLPCGCLYVESTSYGPDRRRPDREVLEKTPVYIVSDLGAKWKYLPRREETVRCVACGNTHLRLKSLNWDENDRPTVERWKDTEDPTPDLEGEIVESEAYP